MGFGLVYPDYGHLGNPVAEAAGQQQRFDIEGKAFCLQPEKDFPGRFLPEKLKAALGVPESFQDQQPDQQVETLSQTLPQPALSLFNYGVRKAASRLPDHSLP